MTFTGRGWWYCVVLLAGMAGAASGLAGESASVRSPFEGEAEFARGVTLAAREEPLGEFLARLRREQGLRVRADATTADERVTVLCRERPAGEILAAVARHLDYSWVRKRNDAGVDFVLLQTAEQRERERRLREAALAEETAALRERIAEAMDAARLPMLERRKQELQRSWALNPDQPGLQQTLERLERGEFHFYSSGHDGRDGMGAALLAMQPGDWERFWRGDPFRFAFPPRPGCTPLSRLQADAVVRTAARGLPRTPKLGGPLVMDDAFGGVDRLRGEVALATEDGRLTLRFRSRSVVRAADVRALSGSQETVLGRGPRPAAPAGDPTVDPSDADLRREVTVPAAQGRRDPEGDLILSLPDAASAAATVGYTVIADSYDDNRWDPWHVGRQRLDAWLKETFEEWDIRVRREGETLFLRYRDWPRRRAVHVPDRVTRPWEAVLKEGGWLTLPMLFDMARLPEDQLTTVLLWRWEERQVPTPAQEDLLYGTFGSERKHLLRLLGTLVPAEWGSLLRGEATVLLSRRPEQREAVREWFAAKPLVGRTVSEGPGHPHPSRPLEQLFEIEAALEEGRVPLVFRLARQPVGLYAGSETVFAARSLAEALELEREVNPKVTPQSLPAIPGIEWRCRVTPLALGPQAEAEFDFLTAAHPSRTKVNSRPERER